MNTLFYYQRLVENAIDTGHAAKRGTFREWQNKAIAARKALAQVKKDYEEDLNEIRATYSPAVIAAKKQELDEKYRSIVDTAKENLSAELDAVIESKQRQFDKCSGAPSAEDLRLLQALNMRSHISLDEFANTVSKLNGNVQSIAVLRDIADRHGVKIPVGANTPAEFDTMLQRAKEYSLDRLQEIDSEDPGYKARAFYDYPDSPGEASAFYNPLDKNVLTTEQIRTATRETAERESTKETTTPEKAAPGENVPMWAEVTASGNMSLSTIAAQFHTTTDEIRAVNPGRDLDRIYSGDKILVPSTRFTFQPDPSGGHVQPDQVRPVPAIKTEYKIGPAGEEIGDDISIL